MSKKELKEGKFRFVCIDVEGIPRKCNADSDDEAKAKIEKHFGIEVYKVNHFAPIQNGANIK